MSTKPSEDIHDEASRKIPAGSDPSDEQQQQESITREGKQDGSPQSDLLSQTSSPTKLWAHCAKASNDDPIDQQSDDEVVELSADEVEEGSITDSFEIGATDQISGIGQAVLLPIADELSEQLTCAICADQFENSVILHNCGHVFCKKCVMLCWQKVAKGPMECPLCRTCLNNKREHSTDVIREQIVAAYKLWKEDTKFKRGLSLAELLEMEKNASK